MENASTSVTFTDALPTMAASFSVQPPSLPEPGGTVTYTLSLTNTSTEPLTLTALSDTLLGGLHGQGDCALPQTLAVGAAYSCTYPVAVSGNAGETLPNTLTAAAQDDEGNPTVENTLAVVAFTDALPSLAASFSVQPPSLPEPGGTVTYTLVLTNTATEPLTLTALSDTLLGGLHGQGDCALPQSLTGGAAYTCKYSAAVSGNAGETLPNTLTAAAQDDEGNTVIENALTTVTFTAGSADLSLVKQADRDLVFAGESLTYTLTISNAGPSDAENVLVIDTLPGQVTLLNATHPYTYTAPEILWELGTMFAGESRQLTVRVSVDSPYSGTITNQAEALTTTPDPDTTNNLDSVDTTLTFCQVSADSYEPDNFYTHAVNAPVDGTLLWHSFHIMADKDWLKFAAEAGQTYIMETSNLAGDVDTVLQLYAPDGVSLIGENDDISPQDQASRLVWTAPANGWYFVRVTHRDPTYDPRYSEICGSFFAVSITLETGEPALAISKSALDLDGGPLYPGDIIQYTIVVTNLLTETQSGVVITDSIPAFTTYLQGSAITTLGQISGPDPLIVTVGALNAGETVTISFQVQVDPDAAGQTITNQAGAASDQQDTPVYTEPVGLPGGGPVIDPGPTGSGLYLPIVARDASFHP